MKVLLIFFVIMLTGIVVRAQTFTQSFQLITGVQINKDLPKGFDVSAQYQLRARNYFGETGSYFFGAVQYALIKKVLSAEFEYRYVTSRESDGHRFGFGLTGKHKWKQFTFSDRLVYQREHEYFNPHYENGHEPTNVFRNRVQIKWDFKKNWDVYVSCEPFFSLSNEGNEISKVRSIAGINWEFKKNHTANIFYQHQAEVNRKEPEMRHTIGCMYEWDMPKYKKKLK